MNINDLELLRGLLAPLGIGGVLGGLMFLLYRRDSQLWMTTLTTVIRDNTKALSELSTVIRESQRR